MRKLVSHLIMTLDGVVQFDAVADSIVRLRDTDEVLADFFGKVAEEDAMVLGRVTYEEWAGYWPTSEVQPFADHINNVAKYVASRTLGNMSWPAGRGSVTLLGDDVVSALTKMKQQPGRNIGIHGSGTLVESLLHAGVLDELRLEIYPVIAGTGARLFRAGRSPKNLQLVDSKTTRNGVVIATYGCEG
ncbi:dihydrofolate reductase [Povalibacter uvarum]|uniref:Dihydrofolate reductase n=1 Tax=Povalibacter uvarum TaxID=732238 RepID=A0A841HWU2_9GAMM|nr:dihydrofolate reductase family protein [Povalibacter uvarum]MBB6096388.1 dihydrofolate reductase [Povalibacter uvarum]